MTEKRTEKEKTAPKALLYLSYNYHNRAPRRAPPVPTKPARAPPFYQAATANWKLSNTFSLRCSLARSLACSPCSKLFAVGRRPSSRKDANDSNANTQSWNVCSARRMIDVWSLDTICLRSCTLPDTSRRSNYGARLNR